MVVLHSRAGIVAMAPSPSRMARVEDPNSLRPRFRSRQARPSRATFDGEAHPSCDRLRGSLRSGDMSLRVHPRGDGALAIAHGTSGGAQFIAPTLSVATSATLPRDVRRRGAPLLRPLARLTAFGGYVATGAPSWRWRPRHRYEPETQPLKPHYCQLPSTIYQLSTTIYQLSTT